MHIRLGQLLGSTCAVVIVFESIAATYHVDDSATSSGTGGSWTSPFNNLQSALTEANNNAGTHLIKVAGGTYVPGTSTSSVFSVTKAMTIHGGYAGLANPNDPEEWDPAVYVTTLSGDINGNDTFTYSAGGQHTYGNYSDNCTTIVSISGTDNTCTLQGLTVRNAHGAAVVCGTNTKPRVRECIIARNYISSSSGGPTRGAGIHGDSGSEPTIRNCSFVENQSFTSAGAVDARYALTVLHSTFTGNRTSEKGGAIYFEGLGECNIVFQRIPRQLLRHGQRDWRRALRQARSG